MAKRKEDSEVLTDFSVVIIGRERARRVVVMVDHPKMQEFLEKNERYVVSRAGNLIRVVGTEKGKPYDVELLPEIARCILRCDHEIKRKRHLESLASEAQLVRARQLGGILTKRVDNSIFLPENPDKLTHGQIGRWIRDAKNILIAEGRWDDEQKREIAKPSRKARSRK